MSPRTPVTVRLAQQHDEHAWRELFHAYRAFYNLTPSEEIATRVWSWIDDPGHEYQALVALVDGHIVGIANYRRFARPSTGSVGLWLDDLFTASHLRGHGVGRSLITELQRLAASEGLSVVRWITDVQNTQAQALYDTLATRTNWVTYDASPHHPNW